jgi:hypothetical protein
MPRVSDKVMHIPGVIETMKNVGMKSARREALITAFSFQVDVNQESD